MRKELPYFDIEGSLGGNQDWFRGFMMRLGGCAAETACELCLHMSIYHGRKELYPYDDSNITKEDYISFADKMRPYLYPRPSGIDRPEIFTEGFGRYLCHAGVCDIEQEIVDGHASCREAASALIEGIDANMPVDCLLLHHRDKTFDDFEWHWFILAGYDSIKESETSPAGLYVKAVTYGKASWLDFERMWDTGFSKRGGLVLTRIKQPHGAPPYDTIQKEV